MPASAPMTTPAIAPPEKSPEVEFAAMRPFVVLELLVDIGSAVSLELQVESYDGAFFIGVIVSSVDAMLLMLVEEAPGSGA